MVASDRAAELVGALTLATDLGAGVPPESALRTALLAANFATAAGLSTTEVADAYWTGLLRYLGCSGFAHETARFGAGEDQALLAAFETTDPARVAEVLWTAITRLGRGAGPTARAVAVARFLSSPATPRQLAEAHCAQAVALARRIGVGDSVLTALAQIYERWDGRGQPSGRRGEELSPSARLLHLANAVEIHLRVGGPGAALAMVRERRGRHFDPKLADLVLGAGPALFAPVAGPSVWEAFLAAEPKPHRQLPQGGSRELATVFAEYVDLKSPYTLGHSRGVARLARAAGEAAGLDRDVVEDLELAGLLHDIGRVSVPNGIWDKPGPLSSVERDRVHQHTYHTDRILAASGPWRRLRDLAASHHERLNGEGYHRRLPASALSLPSRLLAAADVFQALSEARPHRAPATPEVAARLLREESQAGRLDPEAVGFVLAGAGQAVPASAAARKNLPDGLTTREAEVLRLLARGLSNKEIGGALFVSPITVKNHVAHVYQKTGVATRAAAALYAVEQGLV